MKRRKPKPRARLRLSGDPILNMVCDPVGPDEDVTEILRDMMSVLVNSKTGVGLAAPQAGYSKRIIIIKTGGKFIEFVNPQIMSHSKKHKTKEEGCLSYPGRYAQVKRWYSVIVACSNMEGLYACSEFPARIIQHEIDHLDGKCAVAKAGRKL